jgi:hypothetical protein
VKLKKPSVAKPPDGTVFFIDRSLGIEPLRSALVSAGLTVEIHDDHFPRDEEDRVWLSLVGEKRWVVLTKDQRLRYRPLELAALRASQARVFVFTAGNLRGQEIVSIFLKALGAIFKILNSRSGPFIARISQSSRITVVQSGVR